MQMRLGREALRPGRGWGWRGAGGRPPGTPAKRSGCTWGGRCRGDCPLSLPFASASSAPHLTPLSSGRVKRARLDPPHLGPLLQQGREQRPVSPSSEGLELNRPAERPEAHVRAVATWGAPPCPRPRTPSSALRDTWHLLCSQEHVRRSQDEAGPRGGTPLGARGRRPQKEGLGGR